MKIIVLDKSKMLNYILYYFFIDGSYVANTD